MTDNPYIDCLTKEEYAEQIIEQARLNAEFEASNRRIRALINEAMEKKYNND